MVKISNSGREDGMRKAIVSAVQSKFRTNE